MIKNNNSKKILLSSTIVVTITLILTSGTSFANPVGDTVFVTFLEIGFPLTPAEPLVVQVGPDLGGPFFWSPAFGGPVVPHFMLVDIEVGTIGLTEQTGSGNFNPIDVFIEDIEWFDDAGAPEDGEIVDVFCIDLITGAQTTATWTADTITITIPANPIVPADIFCTFTAEHEEPTIDVDIDIKPGSFPNSINTKSMGLVPVAILGSANFDVTQVDVTTLTFGPNSASPDHDLTDLDTYFVHLQDVNEDGFLDLVSHYKQKETGIACGNTEATLSGNLLPAFSGTPIEGTDSVNPKGC